jgi:hypothetical protein
LTTKKRGFDILDVLSIIGMLNSNGNRAEYIRFLPELRISCFINKPKGTKI